MRKRKPPLLACMDMTCTDATWSSTKPAPWSHAHPAVVVTAAGTVVVATAGAVMAAAVVKVATAAGVMGVAVGMQANAKGVTPAHVMAQAVMAVASATNGVMATEVTGETEVIVRTAAMATVKTAVFAAPTATHAVVGAGAVAIKPAL